MTSLGDDSSGAPAERQHHSVTFAVLALAFTLMAVAHSAQGDMYVATAPMGTGIALAFRSAAD